MTNHPNRTAKLGKLPADVYYTARRGGMYVKWNGKPEGSVYYTYDRDTAYHCDREEWPAAAEVNGPIAGMTTDGWAMTPYQGADGSCRRARVVEMAADYSTR